MEPVIRNYRSVYQQGGGPARLISVDDSPVTCTMTYSVIEPAASGRAEAVVDRIRSLVPAELLQAAEVLEGDAVDELVKVSAGLDLLICGSRGYGPVRSTLVGGVSSRLAHAASCPLLVIPRAPVPGIATLTGRGTGDAGA